MGRRRRVPAGRLDRRVRRAIRPAPTRSSAAGDVLVLVPVDGDERRRQAVRLDRAPVVRVDPLAGGDTVLELHWAADDALQVPLPVATRAADGTAAPAAQALANVVLAEHAATLTRSRSTRRRSRSTGPYRPRLPVAGVAWVDETVDESSAAAALLADPRRARAQVALDDEIRTWEAQPDLLASGRLDAHFVVEPESSALVRLRFGDGTAGRRPTAGSQPLAYARVGGGAQGNVGAGVLTRPLATAAGPAPGGVAAVTNPLAALGGQPAEAIEAVQELAPHAFRTQLRAVTSSDYADVAGSNAGVQRAVARRRWTGSWYAQEVTLDLVAARAGDGSVATDVATLLDVRRMAGVDVELAPPVSVALEIVIGVCVADGHARADVAGQVGRELSAGALRDGRLRVLPSRQLHLRAAAVPLRPRRARHGGPRRGVGRRRGLRALRAALPALRPTAGRRGGGGAHRRGRARGAARRQRPEQPRERPRRAHPARRHVTDIVTSCGCDPLRAPDPVIDNLPAQPALSWRVAPHSHALARMQQALGERRPAPDDPAHAVLDAWAVVADVVSFYTERIAQEGFLRTATELRSVRLLARTIGYELRPGVAAQAEIAFDVEDAPGAPAGADVPPGTPVQSIPGQDELPQTFETSAALDARAAWNAVPAATTRPQTLRLQATSVWVRGTALGLREGDAVVLVGADRRGEGPVEPSPPGPFPPGPRFPPIRSPTSTCTSTTGTCGS